MFQKHHSRVSSCYDHLDQSLIFLADALSDPSIENRGSEPSMSSTEAVQNLRYIYMKNWSFLFYERSTIFGDPINDSSYLYIRVFAATWNVGGQCPSMNLDLSDFLQVRNEPDMYVLGYALSLSIYLIVLILINE